MLTAVFYAVVILALFGVGCLAERFAPSLGESILPDAEPVPDMDAMVAQSRDSIPEARELDNMRTLAFVTNPAAQAAASASYTRHGEHLRQVERAAIAKGRTVRTEARFREDAAEERVQAGLRRLLDEIDNPLATGAFCPDCGTRLDNPQRPCPFGPHGSAA